MEIRRGGLKVFVREEFLRELKKVCLDSLPHKAYGLVGGKDVYHPNRLYPCSTNLRNTPRWEAVFASFGEFYRNPDLGFVISPSEVEAVLDVMESHNESLVGVYHSHRFLCAEPTKADIALSSGPEVLCYIVSVVQPDCPEVGIFRLNGNGYEAVRVVTSRRTRE